MGLKINVSKTKIINLNGQRRHTAANVNDIQIEWVTEFNYLGSPVYRKRYLLARHQGKDKERENQAKGTRFGNEK